MSNSDSNQNQVPEHVMTIPEDWLTSPMEKVKKLPKLLNNTSGYNSCSIFRVPPSLKKLHPEAFIPQMVSIGPYYHGKKQLRMIEQHKGRLLGVVLDRAKEFKIDLKDFYGVIAIKEKKIRACYSEDFDQYNSRELTEIMVLDGCFILEFVCTALNIVRSENDPLVMPRWVLHAISADLLKIENQIPFFVLKTLFELLPWSSRTGNASLTALILRFFHFSIQIQDEVDPDICNVLCGEHLLDLFRSNFTRLPQEETTKPKEVLKKATVGEEFHHTIRPVEKLRAAGIKFQKRNAKSFLDIKFTPHGVLEIPSSFIGSLTSSFLLNCIAFEQCYRFCSTHFTSYVIFISCLMSTASDAGHLLDRRIFKNSGSDKELVKFFSELKDDVFIDITESYLAKVIEDVNGYYSNVWHVRLAELKYNYFDSPWTFMSALAALVLLILTILQSFFSVYGYLNPPN